MKYYKQGDVVIVCLYVDDHIFTRNNAIMIFEFREAMISYFDLKDIGLMSYFLSLEVHQMDSGIFV